MVGGKLLPAEIVVIHIGAVRRIGLGTSRKAAQIVAGRPEPLVVVAGVVQNQVGDNMDVPLLALGHQGLEIGHGAVLGIDLIVIPDVVLVVGLAGVDGHEPDAVDAQLLQVIQLGILQQHSLGKNLPKNNSLKRG